MTWMQTGRSYFLTVPDLYRRLKLTGRLKVGIERVRFEFAEAHPDLSDHPERVAYLHQELRSLEQACLIRLPSQQNKKAWLKETNPKLPAWIILEKAVKLETRIDPSQVPWLSELSICAELKHPVLIEAAVAINDFLIERRKNLIPVPMRERSLQIFGDEKRLDALVRNGTLFGGKVPISVIGAIEVEQPLVYRSTGVGGRPLLVIENHHTYWSFCEWNAHAGIYSAIVYGNGNAFSTTGRAIDEVLNAVGSNSVEYFGDLDVPGLMIPVRFNQSERRSQLCSIEPAVNFYTWLLSHGIRRPSDSSRPRIPQAALDWLPPSLRDSIHELFSSNQWIPQESLGTEALASM